MTTASGINLETNETYLFDIENTSNGKGDYKGTWDASTNTPFLANGVGTQGDWYEVSVGGSIDFGEGVIIFEVGDDVVYNNGTWQRASNDLINDNEISVNTTWSSSKILRVIDTGSVLDVFVYRGETDVLPSGSAPRQKGDVYLLRTDMLPYWYDGENWRVFGSQQSTLPTASANWVGQVFQYIGATGNGLVKGYFYECVSDGEEPATYSWVALSTNFTTEEKTKLAGIESEAQENVIESISVNGTEQTITNKGVDISVPTKTSDITNDSGFITKDVDDLTNYTKTSDLGTAAFTDSTDYATAAQGDLADTSLQPNDIVNNTSSTATDKVLSANMGKSLQDQVDNLKARGRFLALWNCATGLAESDPPTNTYTYKSGDYFIIGIIATGSGTNYKPDGSTYTIGVASTTVETEAVDVDDVYYYDGNVWKLQVNTQKTVSFGNIAGDPYDNNSLAGALNDKVTGNSAITGATKCKITYDSKGLVTAGTNLEVSDIPNLASNKVTAMTGYSKASASSAISTSDSLNTAIGKVEYKLDSAISDISGKADKTGYVDHLLPNNPWISDNFNNAKADNIGVYEFTVLNSATNTPNTGSNYIVIYYGFSETLGKQIAYQNDTNNIYVRYRSGSSWSNWQSFAFSSSVNTKADKVSNATAGNFAGLDANGNLTDSGKKASDFALANVNSIISTETDANNCRASAGKVTYYSLPSTATNIPVAQSTFIISQTGINNRTVQIAVTDAYNSTTYEELSNAYYRGGEFNGTTWQWSTWKYIPDGNTKADKVSGATAGDLAALDANGNLTDSGKKVSDFTQYKSFNIGSAGGGTPVWKKITGISENVFGSSFLIQSRGGERLLLSFPTLSSYENDKNIQQGYSLVVLGAGYRKINASKFDYNNKELYLKLNGYSDNVYLTQVQGSPISSLTSTTIAEGNLPTANVIDINIVNLDPTSKADLTDLAPAFSTSSAYAVGQYVTYDGDLYRCISAHTAGAWNSNHFTIQTVSDLVRVNGSTYTGDLNDLTTDGQYFVNSTSTNLPTAGYGIINISNNTNPNGNALQTVQTFITMASPNSMYYRYKNITSSSSSWTNWIKVTTDASASVSGEVLTINL